jgi:hypothetical protein
VLNLPLDFPAKPTLDLSLLDRCSTLIEVSDAMCKLDGDPQTEPEPIGSILLRAIDKADARKS